MLNIMPLAKLGKNAKDLIPTTMTMNNFMGHRSHALGVLVADITAGSKLTRSSFFVIVGKSSYVVILGKDWIHTSEGVLSTIHQKITIWIGDMVDNVEADPNPFPDEVKLFEVIFYLPYMSPIAIPRSYEEGGVESCELTQERFRIKILTDPRILAESDG